MNDEYFMSIALKEAKKAFKKDEIPVGAIIVYKGKIIAKGYNKKNKSNRVKDHAEIIAIDKANKKLKNWRLEDCDIYITLEPCMMCLGAITSSRINNMYIGTLDPKNNEDVEEKISKYKEKYGINVEIGIMQEECEYILKDFFKYLRKNGGENVKLSE